MFEPGRHHADDLNCLTVELDLASDDVWVASKTSRPETIGEDDNVVGAGLELFGFEDAAERRGHSHHGKEIGGCREAQQTFCCLALFGEITVNEVVGRHLFK